MQTGASTTKRSPSVRRPVVLDWEYAKVGDRLASFTAMLPAVVLGPVVLVVAPVVGAGLRWRYQDAVLLLRAGRGYTAGDVDGSACLWWDGLHAPLRPGSVGLLIVDARHGDPEVLRPALAPGGTMAVLGSEGELVVYPDLDRPENIWKSGWPIPTMRNARAQVRRAAGLRTGLGRTPIRLSVLGTAAPTLVDRVLADLETQTGVPCELIGVHTAGDTILRVRTAGGDLAVRASLTTPGREFGSGREAAAEIPAIRSLVQRVVAEGVTCGVPWVATDWLPRRRRSLIEFKGATVRQWRHAERLVAGLETVRTDEVDRTWARRWCDSVAPIVADDLLEQLISIVANVPVGTPTGWAHGDLWPGNVLVDRHEAAIIDWENSARNAPLGIDWLLIAALRARLDDGVSVASMCGRMIDDTALVEHPVGGRPWAEWERPQRAALATAAYVLHLRNRALFDLGFDALDRDVADMIAAATGPPAPVADLPVDVISDVESLVVSRTSPSSSLSAVGQTARGALWLGASALIVKGLQTVVLLVLAALLAPSALGVIAIGTLVMNVSTVVSDLGTSSALVFWRGNVERAARTAVTVALVLSLSLTALAWVLAGPIVHALRAGDSGINVIRGLTAVLPCYAVATVQLELMRRKLQFARRIVPDVVGVVVGTIVAITLAIADHGVAALVVGQIVQGVLVLVLSWVVSRPVVPGWHRGDFRGLIGYGGHLSGSNLAQLALLNIDYLIVSRVLGPSALGQYSLAFRLAYLPYLNIAYVIAGAAFPYLCRLRGEKLGLSAERIASVTITAVLPLCVGIALVADQLELLGEKWEPAVGVVRWLMAYAAILSAGQMVQVALNSAGRPRSTFGLRLLHVAALTMCLLVLARHGIVPVAIGQVVAVSVVAVFTVALARRHLAGFSVVRLLASLAPATLGVATMALVVLSMKNWLPGPDVSGPRLLVLGLAGAVAYAVPVWLVDRERLVQTAHLLRSGR